MADKLAPLGIASLDEQHVAMSADLTAFQLAIAAHRPPDEIRAIVETVLAGVRAHFQYEEALMVKSGYAATAEHRFEHQRIMLTITALMGDALEDRHSLEVLNESGDVLRALFLSHIARVDLALSQHLLSLGMG